MAFKTDWKDEIVSGGKIRQIIDAVTGGVIHEKVLIKNVYTPDQQGDKVTALWMNEVGRALNGLSANVVDLLYPVGSVITNGKKDFNPNTVYSGTTWVQIKGRVIVGVDEDQTEFNTTGKTGGSKELQSHTHAGSIASAGEHTHTASTASAGAHSHTASSNSTGAHTHSVSGTAASAGGHSHTITVNSNGAHSHTVTVNAGGSHSHSLTINSSGSGNSGNLQPYITKYVWERTA